MTIAARIRRLMLVSTLSLSLIPAVLIGSGSVHAATQTSNSATAAAAQQSSNAWSQEPSDAADRIVDFALSLKGKVSYVFGKNEPEAFIFDCSSFTKYVYASQEISLQWGSRAQSQQGEYVPQDDLQPGDLVFFSVGTPGRVNHVGIYIGEDLFIHNTIGKTFNGLLVSKLEEYGDRYITARRVLESSDN